MDPGSSQAIGQDAMRRNRCTPEEKEEIFYCISVRALEEITQRDCGVPLIGDVQELSGCNAVPCSLG